jgi:type II secretory pathway component PulM
MKDNELVSLNLSKNQISKAARGHSIQISKEQLRKNGNVQIAMHPSNVAKLQKALKQNKGVRLQFSKAELEGGNILEWLKKAGKFLKEKVIDTPLYQQVAKPALRQLVNLGVEMAPPGLARDAARKVAEEVSQRTGAFGLKGGAVSKDKKRNKLLLPMEHPAMNPVMIQAPGDWPCDVCGSKKPSKGGQGFKPAGYGMGGRRK